MAEWEGSCPPPKFWVVGKLSENFYLRKCSSKNAKYGVKTSNLGKFMGNIKILKTHRLSFLSEIFSVCRKWQYSDPPTFFNSLRRWRPCDYEAHASLSRCNAQFHWRNPAAAAAVLAGVETTPAVAAADAWPRDANRTLTAGSRHP